MKHIVAGLVLTVALSVTMGAGFMRAQAIDDTPVVLTENQIEAINGRCLASKVALNKLHSADALLRVNLGQKYEYISSRLMAPLNSRIALNSYDGVELAQVTADFNRSLETFRNQYRTYELSVGNAIDIDCQQKPVEYYQAIELFRQHRAELHEATRDVNRLTQEYLDEFDIFSEQVIKDQD